jgi:PadR family transcriptional regulator, regulatory protein AphA
VEKAAPDFLLTPRRREIRLVDVIWTHREHEMSLKYALLGMLAENPKYGYELKKRFEGALGNVWSISYGQLYPTLRRLSELGWLVKKTEPGKKAAEKNIYTITEKGRRKLDEWLLKPLRSSYKVKDEFTLRFLFFRKLSPASVLDYLEEQLKKTVLQKESFQIVLSSLQNEIDFYLQAIIRKGIIHLEAEGQWLEEVMDDLRAGLPHPVSREQSSPFS